MSLLKVFLLSTIVLVSSTFAESFMLDKAHTNVGFKAKHLLVSSVNGNFDMFDGSIEFDYMKKQLKALKGTINVASIDTDNEKRDKHLKSPDFFDAKKFPKMTFVSTKVDGNHLWGDLTIKGITKNIKLEIDDVGTIIGPKSNKRIGFVLEGKINRLDYGLNWNKLLETGGAIVSNEIKLIIELEGIEKKKM
ncbi:YceI family protein [Sulfurospirillum arcachonense]|uniref:YceI family protein n=1 Tax=Sulfurospirillum arcachonense TaxID=57666 RepID=UPI0004685C4C|nr:YceI family protein [Sulfurospirillum arcachonense]